MLGLCGGVILLRAGESKAALAARACGGVEQGESGGVESCRFCRFRGAGAGVGVPGIQGHPAWARATDLGAGIALQNQVWGLMLQA